MTQPTETKPKAFKNARRELLARLKEIKDVIAPVVNAFTVTSSVYERYTQLVTDEFGTRYIENARQIPRPFESYPENSKNNWGAVYAEADRLVALASMLREFAGQQYHEAAARQREYAE